jgi:predicted DNA-binding transcriptional regulator AlpA
MTTFESPLIVDDKKIAEILGMSLPWVRKDRITKRTLPFFRLGGKAVRYDVETVRKAFLARMEGGAK